MTGPTRPEPILSKLREHRPTVLCSVPALYSALVREDRADGGDREEPPVVEVRGGEHRDEQRNGDEDAAGEVSHRAPNRRRR